MAVTVVVWSRADLPESGIRSGMDTDFGDTHFDTGLLGLLL